MASSAKHFALFFFLTLLMHTHARESQFFNKIPSTTSNDVVLTNTEAPNTQQQEPNFVPENENGYGLYGHESGQLPPSTTTTTSGNVKPSTTNGQPAATTSTTLYNTESTLPTHGYLPKNYNPVAYVTEPEDVSDSANPAGEKNYYNGVQNNHYTPKQDEASEYRSSYPTSRNNYFNGGSRFNSQPQGMTDTRFGSGAASNSRENYFNTGAAFRPQGMSDTRFMDNGKYFYDINTEKYSSNHPYESLKARNEYSNRNYFGNGENGFGLNGENSMGGYQQNQDELRYEENNMP